MTPRIRLLPITIFLAALMLTVKLGDIWNDVTTDESSFMRIQPTMAEKAEKKDEQPAAKPAGMSGAAKHSAPEGMKPIATTEKEESEIRDISNLSILRSRQNPKIFG